MHMTLHLERYHLTVSDRTKDLAKHVLAMAQTNNVFYIDTEFVWPIITEIAVLDARGKVILDTFVKYDYDVNDMSNAIGDDSAREVYNKSTASLKQGKTPNEIGRILAEAGMNEKSLLLEWSISGCDQKLLTVLLSMTDYRTCAPITDASIRALLLWREALPGFVSHSLSLLYSVVGKDMKILRQKHRARPDAEMLFQLMEVFFKEIFLKSKYKKGIEGYFIPKK